MFKDDLVSKEKWLEFLSYKLNKEFMHEKEKERLEKYIMNEEYLDIVSNIENYSFSLPIKHVISKNNSKKRNVYTYTEKEMLFLKFFSYLLYQYDDFFSPNLYSFRRETGVKRAIINLRKIKTLPYMYGYKVDISNYFNSIDKNIILEELEGKVDMLCYDIIKKIIGNDKAIFNGEITEEKKGVMAGIPLASFLANFYLKDVDKFFWEENIVYLRYSDDIIIFTHTKEEVEEKANLLRQKIISKKLEINGEKETFFNPKEEWSFLGFSFKGKQIDVSKNSIKKIKGKIKRSAKGIRRWMIKKKADSLFALKAMNRKFNRKFYGNMNNELSWKYWYFPHINTTKGLKEIDQYMQDELRFIVTGKHNKKNYQIVPYKKLKDCNYRPLVHEYYSLLLDMKNKV